jgi:hypothetical protein
MDVEHDEEVAPAVRACSTGGLDRLAALGPPGERAQIELVGRAVALAQQAPTAIAVQVIERIAVIR